MKFPVCKLVLKLASMIKHQDVTCWLELWPHITLPGCKLVLKLLLDFELLFALDIYHSRVLRSL